MSDLTDAIERLERAVARLEAALAGGTRHDDDEAVAAAAGSIAERIDAALSRLDRLLEAEG